MGRGDTLEQISTFSLLNLLCIHLLDRFLVLIIISQNFLSGIGLDIMKMDYYKFKGSGLGGGDWWEYLVIA